MSKMKDKAIDLENMKQEAESWKKLAQSHAKTIDAIQWSFIVENGKVKNQIEAMRAVGDRMAEVLIGEGYDELINAWRAVEDLT